MKDKAKEFVVIEMNWWYQELQLWWGWWEWELPTERKTKSQSLLKNKTENQVILLNRIDTSLIAIWIDNQIISLLYKLLSFPHSFGNTFDASPSAPGCIFDSSFFASFSDDFHDAFKPAVVDCWEEMMSNVDVESCQQKVRPESFNLSIGVTCGKNSVFSVVFNFLRSFGPKFL